MKINYFLIFFICIFILIILVERFFYYKNKQLIEYVKPHWFYSPTSFPYEDFKCAPSRLDKYTNLVKNGYKLMKNKKIIFGGLCMNIENNITRLKERILQLGSHFSSFKCVIFENDSTDSTRTLLNYMCNTHDDFFLVPCPENKNCILVRNFACFQPSREVSAQALIITRCTKFRNIVCWSISIDSTNLS